MKDAIATVSKLSAVIVAALLLTPMLTGTPPQESPSSRLRANRSVPLSKLERASSGRQNFQFQTIDVEGGLYTTIYGIDNRVLAVGEYLDGEWGIGNSLSFLWRNGRQEPLDYQGYRIIDMEKANNRGLVSGCVGTVDAVHAAVFDSGTGTWTLLPDIDGKPLNFCMKINNAGTAVGQACEGNYWSQGNCVNWSWNGKQYSPITNPFPGTPVQYTGPIAINDRGQMVGQYLDAKGHIHSYLQEGSRVTSLDVTGALDTYINDINNLGEVVVDAVFGPWPGPNQNYIWKKGLLTPLPDVPFPDASGTYTHSLNDRGDYSGKWIDANGGYHGFIAVRQGPRE